MTGKVGIYKIENMLTGDCYIGQSIHLSTRIWDHFDSLRRNNHFNVFLQRAYNKYGAENFVFEVLYYCEESKLTEYEQAFVDIWKPKYNICRECVDSNKGIKRSYGTRIKMHKPHGPMSEDHKVRISMALSGRVSPNKGKKYPVGSGHKMSLALREKIIARNKLPWSEEHRHNASDAHIGRKHSEETKHKMSEAQKYRRHEEKLYGISG